VKLEKKQLDQSYLTKRNRNCHRKRVVSHIVQGGRSGTNKKWRAVVRPEKGNVKGLTSYFHQRREKVKIQKRGKEAIDRNVQRDTTLEICGKSVGLHLGDPYLRRG